MEESGGGRCFPVGWGVVAKPCDSCKVASALLFCRVDSAFLCMGCDAKIHHRLGHTTRHERVWMCEVCEQAPASVTCKADAAALCVTCDRDIHSANPLSRRHERFPVVPFYDTAESVVKSAAASSDSTSFLVSAGDETTDNITNDDDHHHHHKTNDHSSHTCLADAETAHPPSWVIPIPTTKLAADEPETKSIDLLFSDSDQFMDFDYPISIHNSGTDSVVPVQVQPTKSFHPMTQQLMNQSSDNYLEIDFTTSKLNSYNNSNNNNNNNNIYTAQSFSQSISSSEVGVVPDGSSISEISYPFGRTSNNSVDLGGSANNGPCQGMDREARVLRYREKRKNRKFEKTIRYASRKAYAETRPRIKGRFAKRNDAEAEAETQVVDRMFTSGPAAFMADVVGYGVVPSF